MNALDSLSPDEYGKPIDGHGYSEYGGDDYGSDDDIDDDYAPPARSAYDENLKPKRKRRQKKRRRKSSGGSALAAFFIMVAGGCAGGAVGAGIWAGVAYATGYEIGIIAWFVGVCVGFGVLATGGEEAGDLAGFTGALLAILSVLVGRAAVVAITFANFAMPMPDFDDPNVMTAQIADQVVIEWEEAGKQLDWPILGEEELDEDSDELLLDDLIMSKEEYPADVLIEAQRRWHEMTPEQQEQERANARATFEIAQAVIGPVAIVFGVLFSFFNPLSLLFLVLAAVSAYRLSKGIMGD